jgi:hypothetical protein
MTGKNYDSLCEHLGYTAGEPHHYITNIGIGMEGGVSGYFVYVKNLLIGRREVPKTWPPGPNGQHVFVRKMGSPRPARRL